LVGIPVNLILLQKIGEHMLNTQKFLISKIEMRVFKREPTHLPEKSFVLCFIAIWILILVAAAFQTYAEGWTFLDGVYCYLITFTTVGFGDLLPGYQSNKTVSLVVWPIFIYLGLCVMANLLNSAVDCALRATLFTRLKTPVADANVNVEMQE